LIVVVAAVIEDGGAFLVTRRPQGTHLAGMWEFPGGKLQPLETHVLGLQREIREELDTDIEVGELVSYTAHAYADRTLTIYFYRCTLNGSPRPVLGQQMRWVPRAELASLAFPPADEELIRRLASDQAPTAATDPSSSVVPGEVKSRCT
jgi:mutator protein MutT